MCGIVAMLSTTDSPVSREALTRATAALHHRGPDRRGHWVSSRERAALGHTRLSIIDLETGDQPIGSEDGSIQIVVNGEFYEHDRIRAELRARGHALRTASDSEIALHLYEEVGTKCLEQLRGEFAFALWDDTNQVLFAARDRFGIKPLYYAMHEGVLFLASEAKALFAAGVPAAWDHESFYQRAHASFDQDRTLFKGVRQLPPGHLLLATRWGYRIVQYWDVNFRKADAVGRESEAEWIEKLRAGLDEAIRIRLRADVPVGFYLSGGIDSSAVLGMAMRHLTSPPTAFTICFDNEAFNEEKMARDTADQFGVRLHALQAGQNELADCFSDAVFHAETVTHNVNFVSRFLLSKLVRESGYRVILSGEGSDEILGGYSHFRRDALLSDPAFKDSKHLVDALQSAEVAARGPQLPIGSSLSTASLRQTLGFVPSWLEARSAAAVRLGAVFNEDYRRTWATRDPFRVFLNGIDVANRVAGRAIIDQSAYLWIKGEFLNYIVVVTSEHMEMANSVEGRIPFLDHHLVELLSDLPASLKISGMMEKYILREAARPFVTPASYARKKHPFIAPPFGGPSPARFGEMMQDVLRGDTLKSLPFFDRGAVVALLDRVLEMDTGDSEERNMLSATLVTVLGTCVMHERFAMT
jgi:asparagine synthase (glutamine-hydrolysing)